MEDFRGPMGFDVDFGFRDGLSEKRESFVRLGVWGGSFKTYISNKTQGHLVKYFDLLIHL